MLGFGTVFRCKTCNKKLNRWTVKRVPMILEDFCKKCKTEYMKKHECKIYDADKGVYL